MIPTEHVCLVCKKADEDSSCTMKGYWERDEHRFDIDICLTCFDEIQNIVATRKVLNRLEEVSNNSDRAGFDKLLDNYDTQHALWEYVLPVWARQMYRDAEEQ